MAGPSRSTDGRALGERLAAAFDGEPGPFTLAVLRSVVQSVPSYIAAVSPDGRFLYMHRFAAGYGPADVENASMYDFLDAPSAEIARRCMQNVCATREPGSFRSVTPARRPGVPQAQYEIRVAPIVEDDAVVALSLVATDVTEHEETQRALRASQDDLALAVEATGMGIWTWDSRTNEVVWDDMMRRHFGLPADESATTYEAYMALVHPEDREEVAQSIARAMETGTYDDLLHRIVVDGELRWVLIKGRVIKDDEGRAIGLRGGVFDVTERKRVDLKMRERQKIEAVGELAAGIAHNFNNMLLAIMGNLDLLEAEVDGPLREHVDAAQRASQAAAAVVRDLGLLTRREADSSRRRAPVREIVESVSSIVRATFTSRVDFQLDLQLGPGDEPYIEVMGRDLEHALLNLCINARDATEQADRRDARVEMSVRHLPPRSGDGHRWVEIAVRDNGIGMDEPTRRRIFEPFFTTKGDGKGTGMGLFTAHRTVNDHGGLLDVRSTPGEGSTFSILLPVRQPDG